MTTTSSSRHGDEQEETKPILKNEYEHKSLESIPSQSTIAEFIKSGQIAFNRVNAHDLEDYDSAETTDEVQKWMLEHILEKLAAASDLNHHDVLMLRPLLHLKCSENFTGFELLLPELSRLMKSNLTYAVAFTNYVLLAQADEVPQTMKDELLHNLAHDLGDIAIDAREHETVERQLTVAEQKEDEDSHKPRPLAKLSAAALGLFIKHFYNLGLYKPVEAMLAHLCDQLALVPAVDLHSTYVPFLQELIGFMLIYGIPLAHVRYSLFFARVLQDYFDRYVGQEPGQKASVEHKSWRERATTASTALESFDHFYFKEILGDQYDREILPILLVFKSSAI